MHEQLMPMLVVCVGKVCMLVFHRFMPMPMRVGFAFRIVGPVRMTVMSVVTVHMVVGHRFVGVRAYGASLG
jgi:hypothetical protein